VLVNFGSHSLLGRATDLHIQGVPDINENTYKGDREGRDEQI